MSKRLNALERRRQVLLATVGLQRFALRADIASARVLLEPTGALSSWRRAALLVVAHAGGQLLRLRDDPLGGALRLLRLLDLTRRVWGLGASVYRFARAPA